MACNIVRMYGDQALLLECESTDAVLATTESVRAAAMPGVLDIVPGSRTVLIAFADAEQMLASRRYVNELPVTSAATSESAYSAADVLIDVVYDGPDLSDVSALTGLSVAAIVDAHTNTIWRVGFGGFAPGFAYLIDGDSRLHVARRAEPRTRVPAGSVGLAGEFSGIYPRESPGGWQLIGRTDAPLWDIDRPQPALLMPGMSVQFRAQ